jgi:anti-sigma factor RsiW
VTGATCIGEPVSWLRLEQLALGELPAPAADAVHAHLGACAVCAACLDQ